MISKDDLDAATHDFINHLRSPRRQFKGCDTTSLQNKRRKLLKDIQGKGRRKDLEVR